MNRTLAEAAVRRDHGETHQHKEHPNTFLTAYDFAKSLKILHGLPPHESGCVGW